MILTRSSIFIWMLGIGLVISMLPSHSLAQAIEGNVSVTGKAVGSSGLQRVGGSKYTDYTVEYVVTISSAGVTAKFTTEGAVRVLGGRSWYGYHMNDSFELVCGQPPEGVDGNLASIALRAQNSLCECDPDLKADSDRQFDTALDLFEAAYEQNVETREEFIENLKHIFPELVIIAGEAGIEPTLHKLKDKGTISRATSRLATAALILEALLAAEELRLTVKMYEDGRGAARDIQEAGHTASRLAIEALTTWFLQANACHELREQELEKERILQEANEIHTEWMVEGGRWYEDPISGDFLRSADAFRRIKERLENPDARNSDFGGRFQLAAFSFNRRVEAQQNTVEQEIEEASALFSSALDRLIERINIETALEVRLGGLLSRWAATR